MNGRSRAAARWNGGRRLAGAAACRAAGGVLLATPDELADLARRVDRLRPSHRDPESFHVEKGEIAEHLRALARSQGALV